MALSRNYFTICLVLLGVSCVLGLPEPQVSKECDDLCGKRGLCVKDEGELRCLCYPEWEGEQCEFSRSYSVENHDSDSILSKIQPRFDECSLVPTLCMNGGVCQFNGTDFSCECSFAFIGARCEIRSPCFGFCLNGGYCTLEGEVNSTCNCTGTGFKGVRCDVPDPAGTTLPPEHPLCRALRPFCNDFPCQMVSGRPNCICGPNTILPYCDPVTAAPTVTQPPPTAFPTAPPTAFPTAPPTAFPTAPPTAFPTAPPTAFPTAPPTAFPTAPPTAGPIPGRTCVSAPCLNNRPCYNNGNSYYCFCGNLYTGFHCEIPVGK